MTSPAPAALVVLLALQLVATITDIARHRIPNLVTYPGIIAGLGLNAAHGGWGGLEFALAGLLFCGALMLLCFFLFPIGGGDLKLVAMMGASLGVERGIEALLWTFILGGVAAVAILIWKFGLWTIVRGAWRHLALVIRSRSWVPLTEAERGPLQWPLYLAPSGLAAVCLVLADHHWGLFAT